jgi:hypothetical protein
MEVRPAAGPETLMGEPLKAPTTTPPMTPAMMPDMGGAPEPRAIPRQSGNATKKTTTDAGKSFCNKDFIFTMQAVWQKYGTLQGN